jgi:spore maturation protein CgeB
VGMSAPQKDVAVRRMRIVVLGLSITSSWGNGHATTYRGLLRELAALGHDVLFLERDVAWYAGNRDLRHPGYARVELYANLQELTTRYACEVRNADLVMVGSYVPEGVAVGEWVTRVARGLTAFYDIDTPITLEQLAEGRELYLSKALIPKYSLYLSFTGGPALEHLEHSFGARLARPLYCSVDPDLYHVLPCEPLWQLAYMGTYSEDRQPTLERLLLEPAQRCAQRRFAVVGPQYPESIAWPDNVARIAHLAPEQHCRFYNQQRFTLNVTRARMREMGYSPSVRLFEAAACGTPIISDAWAGLDEFFEPGTEILIADSARDTMNYLMDISDAQRRAIGMRARERVLSSHTAKHRAQEMLQYLSEASA